MAAAAQSRLLGALLVREVMTADPITTTPDTPLGQAAAIMLRRKVGCLPVVEGERLVGILTEADFVAHVAALSADESTPPGSG
jgi:CBS domain-containing protein